MQTLAEIKDRLRTLVDQLSEPAGYFPDNPGEIPGEPENLLFIRRNPQLPITLAADAEKLYHKRYVLTVNLQTDGLVCVNEKTFPLPVDYASLVYPFQTHHYLVDQEDFYWLVITFEWNRAGTPELMYRSSRLDAFAFLLLERMLRLYLDGAAGNPPLLQRYLGCLLLELADAPERIDADHHLPADNSRMRLFEEINGHIFQKLDDPALSVEELARDHYISTSHLYWLFNHMAGCNPGEYIRSLRINQALKLLNNRELLVSEIADRTGFSSLPIFSRCFRRVVGVSPSEYLRRRENHPAEPPEN